MSNRVLYFAYGSNICIHQMQDRCRNSNITRIGKAHLKDHRIIYSRRSSKWDNLAVASIMPSKGEIVWGILYGIDECCLCLLDKHEGYPNFYDRRTFCVLDDEGNLYSAIAYYFKDEYEGKRPLSGEPSKRYVEHIAKCASDAGIDEEYIKKYIKKGILGETDKWGIPDD